MVTKNLEDLYDITNQLAMVMAFERHFFAVARHLSKDYDGGQWESVAVGKGWCFLLDTEKKFNVDGYLLSSKTFSFAVVYIVFVDILNELSRKGLEKDPLYKELQRLWLNANQYVSKELGEDESIQYYKILD